MNEEQANYHELREQLLRKQQRLTYAIRDGGTAEVRLGFDLPPFARSRKLLFFLLTDAPFVPSAGRVSEGGGGDGLATVRVAPSHAMWDRAPAAAPRITLRSPHSAFLC